jgi:flagellar basal-body rod modification protein FlgD
MSTKLTDSSYLNTTNGIANNELKKTETKTTKANDALGKQDFLQLLVKQMQYQDPLDPQDNSAFVAQLAQFSSVEQMTNLNTSMNSVQANSIVGRIIGFTDDKGDAGYGTVTSIKYTNGEAKLIINNTKTEVPFSKVLYVGPDTTTSSNASQMEDLNTVQASGLIGKKVTWIDSDKKSQSGTVTSVKIDTNGVQVMVGGKPVRISSLTNIETAS